MAASELADIVLTNDDGKPVRLGDLWRERPVVLAFLRHFGWVFSRRRFADVAARLEDFRVAGADVVAIGRGTPAKAKDARREAGWPCLLLVDEDGAAYRAAGTRRTSFWGLLRPRLWKAAMAARQRGFRQGKTTSDPRQLGATIVVAPGGRVLYEHVNRYVEDDAPLDEVLASLPR